MKKQLKVKRTKKTIKKKTKKMTLSTYFNKIVETKQYRIQWNDTMNTDNSTNHDSSTKSYALFTPAEGVGVDDRIGNSLFALHVKIDLCFTVASAYSGSTFGVRVLIIRLNKYVNNYLAASVDPLTDRYKNIYETTEFVDAYPYTDSGLLAQPPNKNAFTVLSDTQFLVSGTATQHSCHQFRKKLNLNRKLNYIGPGSAVLEQPMYILISACNIDGHTSTNVLGFRGFMISYYKDS